MSPDRGVPEPGAGAEPRLAGLDEAVGRRRLERELRGDLLLGGETGRAGDSGPE